MSDEKATDPTPVKKPKGDDVKAQVNSNSATIRLVIKALENVFGIDINRDGKVGRTYLPLLLTIMLISGLAFSAEVLRDGWGTGENFGTYAVYGDDATDTARLQIDSATITTLNVSGTTTLSGTTAVNGALNIDSVVVPDTNAYTVVASDSGQAHFVPDQTADITITMPAEAANLNYKFVYVGGAADAQDWIIDTGTNTAYYVGGAVQFDPGDTNIVNYYSDGNSNSKMGVLTPEAGTVVEFWCEDGVTWYVKGNVVSDTDTGVTFADQ